MVNIDPVKLSKVVQRNETSESLFKALAARDRDPRDGQLILSRMADVMRKQRLKFNKQEILGTFIELEKLGVGKVKGNIFAVTEGVSLKSLGLVALKQVQTPTKLPIRLLGEHHARPVLIPLSNDADRVFEARFPDDITAQELEFVCAFIKRTLA